jgi:hypothetical protein
VAARRSRSCWPRLKDEPVLVNYVRRLLLDGGDAADALFSRLSEATEAGMRALVDAGIVRPAADERTRTAFLLANDLSLLMMRRQITRATGTDPLARDGLTAWTAVVMDVYTGGIFAAPPRAAPPGAAPPGAAPAPGRPEGQPVTREDQR